MNKLKEEVIRNFKQLPKKSKLMWDFDNDIIAWGNKTGAYSFRNYAIYISREDIDLSDEAFLEIFYKVEKYLSKNGWFEWFSNQLIDADTGKILELELIFVAIRTDFIIKAIKDKNTIIDHEKAFQASVLCYIGKIIHNFLKKEGHNSFYSRIYKSINRLRETSKDTSHFSIEIRPAQKNLYTTSLLKEIKKNCDPHSPIEFTLAKEMSINNIPFIQKQKITENTQNFHNFKSNKRIITRPDFLTWTSERPIAIYCDGHRFHNNPEQIDRDRKIDRKLQNMGYIVLRFPGSKIYNNVESCVEEIKEHFFGKQFSKITYEILMKKLATIDMTKLNEMEKKFLDSIHNRALSGKDLNFKQERELNKIIKKTGSYDFKGYNL